MHDHARVMATYSRENPSFTTVTGARYTGERHVTGNYVHLWDGFQGPLARSLADARR